MFTANFPQDFTLNYCKTFYKIHNNKAKNYLVKIRSFMWKIARKICDLK